MEQNNKIINHADCRFAGTSLEEKAKRYSMEYILELFPKKVATFKKTYTAN